MLARTHNERYVRSVISFVDESLLSLRMREIEWAMCGADDMGGKSHGDGDHRSPAGNEDAKFAYGSVPLTEVGTPMDDTVCFIDKH